MQITGEFECVQNALHKVTNRLREYLLANEMPVDARTKSDRGFSVESVKGNVSTRRKSAFLSRRSLLKVLSSLHLLCTYFFSIFITS